MDSTHALAELRAQVNDIANEAGAGLRNPTFSGVHDALRSVEARLRAISGPVAGILPPQDKHLPVGAAVGIDGWRPRSKR